MVSLKVALHDKIRHIKKCPATIDEFRLACDTEFNRVRLFENAQYSLTDLQSNEAKMDEFLSQSQKLAEGSS